MHTSRLLCSVSVFCLLSVSTSGQRTTSTSSSPATSDPQAVALVQKALAALTGGASVTDVTLTGSARRIAGSDDETGTATLTATSVGDSKVSLSFRSGNRTEIRNHSALPLPDSFPSSATLPASVTSQPQPVGAWSGPDGVLHPMFGHNLVTDATWFFPALSVANISSGSGYVLSYVGQETFDGQAVQHVLAFQQNAASTPVTLLPNGMSATTILHHLSQMDFYLDAATFLPVALAFNAHPDANSLVDIAVQVRFSSYRSISGVQVPFHVQKYLNNALVFDFEFANGTLNSGLSSSTFQLQ